MVKDYDSLIRELERLPRSLQALFWETVERRVKLSQAPTGTPPTRTPVRTPVKTPEQPKIRARPRTRSDKGTKKGQHKTIRESVLEYLARKREAVTNDILRAVNARPNSLYTELG